MDRDDPAYPGQRDYNALLLNLYDPLVLGPVARHVWRCPVDNLVRGYREHVRGRHLDVGPGTGYFLAKGGLPSGSRVTIVDPNRNVLAHVSRRLRTLDVTAVEADVLKPLPVDGEFDSAALHLVIHCLPGPRERKARAAANIAAVLRPDGVLFGATVLGDAGPHTRLSRAVLHAFNRQGGFDNLDDSEEVLEGLLAMSFERVRIRVVGSVAMFAAEGPRTPPAPAVPRDAPLAATAPLPPPARPSRSPRS
jgi:SAM-dependent methyltransferase